MNFSIGIYSCPMHPIHLVGLYTTRLPVFRWKARGYDWILVDSIGQPSTLFAALYIQWLSKVKSSQPLKYIWVYCQICCIALHILQTSKAFWVFLLHQFKGPQKQNWELSEGNHDGEWNFCRWKEAGIALFLQVTRIRKVRKISL